MRTLFEHFSVATGALLPLLQSACERRTEDAVLSLVATLPPNSEALVLQELDQGIRWMAGHFLRMSLAPRHQAKPTSPP